MYSKNQKALVVLLILFLFLGTARAAEIKDIRFSHSQQRTRFVIEFDAMPKIKMGLLKEPLRLFFDLQGVDFSFKKNHYIFSKGIVKDLRIGKHRWGTRVVFTAGSKPEWKSFTLKDPPRLVVDFLPTDKARTERPSQKDPDVIPPQWLVVIDPGHGGHDPGAPGPGGLKEKDITLEVAEMVRQILEKRYHIKVRLTREDDSFLSLARRTKIANSLGADLFVSIHLNAHRDKRVRGLETYILNWTNDREALRVAARENRLSLKEMKKQQGEISVMLASLRRSAKRDHSLKLAYFIHKEITKTVGKRYGIPENGIKQALFYVLVGAKMPSVLVELAYISNPKEASLLSKRATQQAYAEAIARAIYRYLMSLPEAPKLAMAGQNLRKYD